MNPFIRMFVTVTLMHYLKDGYKCTIVRKRPVHPQLQLCFYVATLLYLEDTQHPFKGCGNIQGPWSAFLVPMSAKCTCVIKKSRLAKYVVSSKGKQRGYALYADMWMFIFLFSSSPCENSQMVISIWILLFWACPRLSRTPVSSVTLLAALL